MGYTFPDLCLQFYGANHARWNKLDLHNVEEVLPCLLIAKCNLGKGYRVEERVEGRGKSEE